MIFETIKNLFTHHMFWKGLSIYALGIIAATAGPAWLTVGAGIVAGILVSRLVIRYDEASKKT